MRIRGNGVTLRTQKVIQGSDTGHVWRPCWVSPGSSLSGTLLRVTGPLPSLHVIWQTELKPLLVTNAKNGAIPLSLMLTIQTIHAICYKASEWVGGSLRCRRGLLGILWMSPFGCRRSILVILWMSLRVGIVPCVSKIDTLGLFLSLLKTWGSDTFDDSFTSTTCLYLSPSQLCLIKREICLRSNGVIR